VTRGLGIVALVLAVAVVACGGGSSGDDVAPDASGPPDASPPPCLPAATHALSIAAGAFPPSPDHPNVIVAVPPGFDPTPPVDVVVYIHGFNNCITNVLGDTNTACTPGGPARIATGLAAQLDTAGKNALLILPEVAYDQASGNPGALGTDGGFRALLDETLAALPPPLGPLAVDDLGRVVVASHSSGGYQAVAAMITIGGIDADEVWLFDSLYGELSTFEAWCVADLASFASARRFATFYTDTGGTAANNLDLADRAATWVASDPSVLVDDRTTATWDDDTYHHGLLFKRSALSHDGVPQYYVERMIATSAARPRTCQ
jgi:hypothetical protein